MKEYWGSEAVFMVTATLIIVAKDSKKEVLSTRVAELSGLSHGVVWYWLQVFETFGLQTTRCGYRLARDGYARKQVVVKLTDKTTLWKLYGMTNVKWFNKWDKFDTKNTGNVIPLRKAV